MMEFFAICSHDRAICDPMLGASYLIMSIVCIMSWSRSAENSGFVIVIKVVNSITVVSSSTSI